MSAPRFSNLEAWLRWQETVHPAAIDLGLARVEKVARTLGVLSPQAQVITVAGTNGKGSCVAALETLLMAAGQRVGSFSSPHILHYNERIKINGQCVSDEALCAAFDAIDRAREDSSLTYFEFGTLAALYLFTHQPLDYWVLEVGLGGRLDACNIVDPNIAVITSIAIDHIEWLGDDRELIGREKAGICRPGTPLVCADPEPPNSVLNRAAELACPTYHIGRDFGFDVKNNGDEVWLNDDWRAPLTSSLSRASVAAALQVTQLLGLLTPAQQPLMLERLQGLRLAGRMQVWKVEGRTLVLDVAHNPAAMEHLAQQLQKQFPGVRFKIVIAMMADKNIAQSLGPLKTLAASWYLTTIGGMQRGAQADALAMHFADNDLLTSSSSVRSALEQALQSADSDPILVTGSFYTVALATEYLESLERVHEVEG